MWVRERENEENYSKHELKATIKTVVNNQIIISFFKFF